MGGAQNIEMMEGLMMGADKNAALVQQLEGHERRICRLESGYRVLQDQHLSSADEARQFWKQYADDEIARAQWRAKMEADNKQIVDLLKAASTARKAAIWVKPFIAVAAVIAGLVLSLKGIFGWGNHG